MCHIRPWSLPLVLLLAVAPATASAQGDTRAHAATDWASVDLFWQVHDLLAADREPPAVLWDSLFTSTGYAAIEARERRAGILRQGFRAAFKPSLRDSLTAVQGGHPWLEYHLPLIADAPQWRAAITALRAPGALDALLDTARTMAAAWLPDGATEQLPMGRIAWAVFGSQRGYPDLLLLDPTLFIQHPDRAPLLGHELHHNYRAALAPGLRPLGNDLAAWAIVNVEAEGIAGQVDKRPLLELSTEALAARYHDGVPGAAYYRDYPQVHGESPRWLRLADSLLARLASETDSAERVQLGATLHGALPDNGRAMGSWMADVIDAQLGRAAVTVVVGNPFGFWRAYQEAAVASHGRYPPLSAAAMQTLSYLEAQYRLAQP